VSKATDIHLDVAIIGGGNAGITLAATLSAQKSPLKTLVFEPKTPQQRDCCWSLWATPAQSKNLDRSILGKWPQWRLIDDSREVLLKSHNYEYITLSAEKYLQHCEDNLAGSVGIQRCAVDQLSLGSGSVAFQAGGKSYTAKNLFDSRPPAVANNSLRQHFMGWEIRTKTRISETDIATLMDFRVDQSRGLHFIYALPFSDHHLFIESTMISKTLEDKQWYRDAISHWLQRHGLEIDELLREEIGVIPMEEIPHAALTSASIGAASGAVRLSSGYAFAAIQAQMTRLAGGIATGDYSVPKPTSSYLSAMDRVFNGVLLSRPDLAVDIFMRTGRALNGDQFARFMLGSASLWEWIKVTFAMPKRVFIRQVWRQVLGHD
jgi:lycopene beta-cyclase